MISVKNIVLLAAEFVDVKEYVDDFVAGNVNDDNQRVIDGLVQCFNLVENELALDYLPLVKEDTISTADGCIPYSALHQKAAYIIGVYDRFENSVQVKRFATHLQASPGEYVVRYAAIPIEKEMEDASEYEIGVSERTFAYGVAAEYCLLKGLQAESAVWDKKYKKALAEIFRAKGSKRVKARSWV
ncbi:MAG: hypothetical protein E7367_03555 [Clostridiales bacterium]|nr:hypothetical protein [Clostridiales bacterium]